MRHAAHRPEAEDVGLELLEMEGQLAMIVALDLESLTQPDRRKVVILPVRAQAAKDVGLVAVGLLGVAIPGGQDVDLVAAVAEVAYGRPPDLLVAAEMMGRIEISDCQDPHRRIVRGRYPARS
jgi:hypothetical protein